MADDAKAILFVDDERNVLRSLRRSLRREGWEMLFANSGAGGLELLKAHRVDLVVSDMRMPGMDGVTFLKQVKELYPHTVRIILTGYAEKGAVRQVLAEECAREMLTKPWDDEELKGVIRASLQQSEEHEQEGQGLQQILNAIPSLPTLPQVYLEIRDILKDSDNLSADRIGAVIERDPSISARLLRWANSALFGQRQRVETVQRAVVVLGMEMVEGLVLSMSVFDSLSSEAPELSGFNREAFWKHSLACGAVARLIAKEAFPDPKAADRAFTAGLLHDMGKLVEDRYLHDPFGKAVRMARETEGLLMQAELETLATTHAEIGGYLANWWNLPPFLVNAIRWHHAPHLCDGDGEIVPAVHTANILTQRLGIGASGNFRVPAMDTESWSRFRLSENRLAAIRHEVERGVR